MVWSHDSIAKNRRHHVADALATRSLPVASFAELVSYVAQLSYHNPAHVLFFRGQRRQHTKTNKDGLEVPSLYPSIYRSHGGPLGRDELAGRFELLDAMTRQLPKAFKKRGLTGHALLTKFPELAWAVLQHYEVCPTPLLDVTHSLRVAASFALQEAGESAYLYVFGLPHPNGIITYSADMELMNIRLLSVCPPQAKRPYFQEGFTVGTFPPERLQRNPSLDCGRRLIGQFELRSKAFWSRDFPAIPREALYPQADRVAELCLDLAV